MNKDNIIKNGVLPAIRIIIIEAAELCYWEIYQKGDFAIKNQDHFFDKHFADLMPPNLDLLYLYENKKLKLKQLGGEYYSFDIVNIVFKYPLMVDKDNNRVFKKEEADDSKTITQEKLRELLYLSGFVLNGKKYVRYKRSAGSAKSGSCLFIKDELFATMNKWSLTGLNESEVLASTSLTSYEAYRALSLSSLIAAFKLKPHNILFVKDFKYKIMKEEVVKIYCDNNKHLVPSREESEVENNLFDGEGLLNSTVFRLNNMYGKGMMLLRNRFFKCCAFNTKLQLWFEKNNITSVDQLNGITFAKNIKDIQLVVSESCLKYLKMSKNGFTRENIKKWCDEISDENGDSLFGVVKTDKPSRFFGGDMVETTYQLLNTLELSPTNINRLIAPYMDYINKIRDIDKTPEFVRQYLLNEVGDDEKIYIDDSEDQPDNEELFNYSAYSFKSKVCFDLIKTSKNIIYTTLFKKHLFENIISSFRLKIYGGRVLVDGTYATLFGNPLEFLKYITLKDNKPMFSEENISSCLKKDEIYCTFFPDGQQLVGSRAPHMLSGNILCAKNKRVREIDTWFNLSRYIVVVDAINNNIQQRLNGMDYDSDSVLLTSNKYIIEAALKNYNLFPVPVVAFDHNDTIIEKLDKKYKTNLLLNLVKIDCKISDNNTGQIVNLSQQLNSHLWDKIKKNNSKTKELYNQIAVLAVLAGAEIDSSKRTFDFDTLTELKRIKKFARDNNYSTAPAFFYFINAKKGKRRPKINQIENHISGLQPSDYLKTTMDKLWIQGRVLFEVKRVKTIQFLDLIRKDITSKSLSGPSYEQIKQAIVDLKNTKDTILKEKQARRLSDSYDLEKRKFQAEINSCFPKIKTAINTLQKVKYLIKQIEDDKKANYSVLYILLYIISLNEKSLDYSLIDLFPVDGGIPALIPTKKKTKYVLFDKYYYERDVVDNLIAAVLSKS